MFVHDKNTTNVMFVDFFVVYKVCLYCFEAKKTYLLIRLLMYEPFVLNPSASLRRALSKHARLSTTNGSACGASSIPTGHKGERELKLHKAEAIMLEM
jgi:hypothetical protein